MANQTVICIQDFTIARFKSSLYNPLMKIWLEDIEKELYKWLPLQIEREWVDLMGVDSGQFRDFRVFESICEPARDLVYRGGKRWRPLLMLLTARMLGGQRAFERALQLVSVVEFPHNGSLIIDDIEDSSDMRRGKPATHITHGVDISINAGNLLYYLPTLAIDTADVPDEIRLRLYRIYARYMRRVHLGQGMDITWHHTIDTIPDISSYETMCRLKTGCLAAMGSELGAAVATDNEETIAQAGSIAETIGLGFQILDDVINLEKGNPGKRRGDDIVENKKSLPIILYATLHPEKNEHLFSVFGKAQSEGYAASEAEILELIGEVEKSGALTQARAYAKDLFGGVKTRIEQLYEPSSDREFLLAMVNSFMEA